MTHRMKRLIAACALGVMALGTGAALSPLLAPANTDHARTLIVEGDIGDGTSPSRKG